MHNVLSIDFDYFVAATADERCDLFPDANDNLPISLSNMVWITHYANNPPMKTPLSKIGVIPQFDDMVKYLNSLMKGSVNHAYICESHMNLYKHLVDLIDSDPQPVNLVHIDHHHDCFSRNRLDCGNWLYHWDEYLKEYYKDERKKCSVKWIHNTDSMEMNELYAPKDMVDEIVTDSLYDTLLKCMGGVAPDFIFLCKSSPWVPPHLDKYFSQLVKGVNTSSYGFCVSTACLDRYTKEFKKQVRDMAKVYKDLYAKM